MQAIIHTPRGDIRLNLFDKTAPGTVANFVKLIKAGFYDQLAFHRVVPQFVIQGGCPNTKAGKSGMPGTGGPGYQIKAEFNAKSHVRGVISMARSAHPDSAGSQFFLCHGDAKFLDRQYTAFGKLIGGDEVLEAIGSVETTFAGGREKSRPTRRMSVESVQIVPRDSVLL